MKLLTFQAKSFHWKSFERTVEEVEAVDVEDEALEAVVVFLHAEEKDAEPDERARVFKRSLKHIKWVANKRDLKRVVLHSFTHLGGGRTEPSFAQVLIDELAERLRATGYEVWQTPFGHLCSWDLSVHGESMAKVWTEF